MQINKLILGIHTYTHMCNNSYNNGHKCEKGYMGESWQKTGIGNDVIVLYIKSNLKRKKHADQFVLYIYFCIYGIPLENDQAFSDHKLKENWLSFSKSVTIAISFFVRDESSYPPSFSKLEFCLALDDHYNLSTPSFSMNTESWEKSMCWYICLIQDQTNQSLSFFVHWLVCGSPC